MTELLACPEFINIRQMDKCPLELETIHLRRRQIVTIFDPYPLPSAFQQNAYEGDFPIIMS